jgi:nucleotide-binding universal stress UspA family protein
MFARLLVGLDGSAGAAAALAAAVELGRRFHSTVLLAAVAHESAAAARAQALLDAAARDVRSHGLEAETVVLWGEPEDELLRLLGRAEALVVGRRGVEHGDSSALGDTTVRLVRRAPKPVLVAGEAASSCLKPVVAYDGGDTSGNALVLAARYAEAVDVGLDVVYASDDAAEASELLARAGAFLSRQPVAFATHHLKGEPAPAIAAHVAATGADLLVAGAHGGRRRSWPMGSTAEALLRATGVPVIIHR